MKHKANPKRGSILVHLPENIKVKILEQAKKEGRSLSSYARLVLLRDLVKKEAS